MNGGVRPWRPLLVLSAGLYLLALLLPGLVPSESGPYTQGAHADGFVCALFGFLGVFVDPVMIVAWSANVFYAAAFLLVLKGGKSPFSFPASAFAFTVSLTAFLVRQNTNNVETGPMVPVHLGSGAYVWMASLALLVPASFLRWREAEKLTPAPPPPPAAPGPAADPPRTAG